MCSTTPRFSLDGSKLAAPSSNDGSTGGARAVVYGWGMGTGWVLGGVIPVPSPAAKDVHL